MTLARGLVLLRDADADSPVDLTAVGTVSTDLDKPGWEHGAFLVGVQRGASGALWVDRPYLTGNPDPGAFGGRAARVLEAGGWVQALNEPDLADVEHWQGGPESYHAWLGIAGRPRVLHAPISGAGDLAAWVDVAYPHGHAVHVYGAYQEMRNRLQWYLAYTSGPIVITECNPGAGQTFNLAEWAAGDFRRFLDYCASQPRVLALLYFAWRWDRSPTLPSSVDAAGCPAVVDALRATPQVQVTPTQETVKVRLGLLYRMGVDVPEKNVDELAALCQRGGFSAICPKAMDGTSWEGAFDSDPVLALKNSDALIAQRDAYAAHGLAYEPWVVYRGIDAEGEASAHATVARLCGTVIVDFEWMYAGFADHGDFGDALTYFANLRAKAPNATIVLCPDPRQVAAKAYDLSAIAPYVTWTADQAYYTDFQRPALEVLAEALGADHAGLDYCPMLPANSTPDDLDAALTFVANNSGSRGPRTVYLFQRVGLRDENLPILAKHATLWTANVPPVPTPPAQEEPMLTVDKAAYESAYWAPLYQRQQQDAAMVTALRATGNHADALLADAIEKAAGVLQPTVSLHKIVCGAEAA